MKKHPMQGARDRARALRREMTEAERRIWKLLRSRQLDGYRFRRQVPLGRYIADLVCHEVHVIVEVDGGHHDAASLAEAERSRFLRDEGYQLLRFWNNEVLANPEGVQATIIEHLRRDHPHPTLPHPGGGL
jgi:very-short-patch-repair endonuclease